MGAVPLGVALLVCAAVGCLAYWRGRADGAAAEDASWRSFGTDLGLAPRLSGGRYFVVIESGRFSTDWHNPLVRARARAPGKMSASSCSACGWSDGWHSASCSRALRHSLPRDGADVR